MYAHSMAGGVYAEYVAVDEDAAAPVPPRMSTAEAGALGADVAVDGKRDDVPGAARGFAPDGLDAALVVVHGDSLGPALATVREGGRIAYPNGVEPSPEGPAGVTVLAYDGEPGHHVLERLNRRIAAGPFHVEIGKRYPLRDASRAHREIAQHHLGKLELRLH